MNVAFKNYDSSGLEGKSATIILPAGVPSIPRKQEDVLTYPALPKPEPSAAQRALIDLRSLHGQKHALNLIQLKRTSATASGRSHSREGVIHSVRGRRRPLKSGPPLKDSSSAKGLNSNDTVKHLMHQLSELNNISYGRIVKGGGKESFCSEMTLQSRRDDISEKETLNSHSNSRGTKPEGSASNQRSHNVMKLIERQILRDLTRHIQRTEAHKGKTMNEGESPDTKTHSDELPGGMKVVIKKTARRDDNGVKLPRSGDVKSRKHEISLPAITKTAPANLRRRRPETYEWSLDDARQNTKSVLPTMHGVAVHGQPTPPHLASELTATEQAARPRQKSHTHLLGEGKHSSLPKIQEEPDTSPSDDYGDIKITRDAGTNVSPLNIINKDHSPSDGSPENSKVKLPILGKSIGQHKELNYENGSKFIKPSIGEIKRIIHGLYGDYFDFTLDRYYTYEKQLNETRPPVSELDKPLHYVTPAWDDSDSPAASHTLKLFNSGSRKSDESHTKQQSQKMPAPLIRSKYGKAIASINKSTERAADHQQKTAHASVLPQSVMRGDSHALEEMEYAAFLREGIPHYERIIPNTPNEAAIRNHIAYQVALYHEQIARENRSLQQTNLSNTDESAEAKYVREERTAKTAVTQFSEDIDRYAQYLEAYLEAKRKHSEERKARLRDFKQRQKEKNSERNKHLEVVEHRDTFLAQVAKSNVHANPKTPKTAGSILSLRDSLNGKVTFEYVHEDSRFDKTPIAKMRTQENEKPPEAKGDKQAMGTKIYRIFGERKKSATSIRRWVAEAPAPYTSRLIKRQVTQSSKRKNKTSVVPPPRQMKQRVSSRPRVMTDLVSRFQVATRYKLDRDYVASLASGTI